MERPYVPISCAVYDELLVLASRGCQCEIRYGDAGRRLSFAPASRMCSPVLPAGAEFVRLDSGATLRLGRLIEVAGRPLPNARLLPASKSAPGGHRRRIVRR